MAASNACDFTAPLVYSIGIATVYSLDITYFINKNERNERSKVFLREPGDVTDECARIYCHQDEEYESHPQADPQPERQVIPTSAPAITGNSYERNYNTFLKHKDLQILLLNRSSVQRLCLSQGALIATTTRSMLVCCSLSFAGPHIPL